jgi:hypothetical protein
MRLRASNWVSGAYNSRGINADRGRSLAHPKRSLRRGKSYRGIGPGMSCDGGSREPVRRQLAPLDGLDSRPFLGGDNIHGDSDEIHFNGDDIPPDSDEIPSRDVPDLFSSLVPPPLVFSHEAFWTIEGDLRERV